MAKSEGSELTERKHLWDDLMTILRAASFQPHVVLGRPFDREHVRAALLTFLENAYFDVFISRRKIPSRGDVSSRWVAEINVGHIGELNEPAGHANARLIVFKWCHYRF